MMKILTLAMACLLGFSSPLLAQQAGETAAGEAPAATASSGTGAVADEQDGAAVAAAEIPGWAIAAGFLAAAIVIGTGSSDNDSATSHATNE